MLTKEELKVYVDAGMTDKEVAEKTFHSESSVSRYRTRYGFYKRKKTGGKFPGVEKFKEVVESHTCRKDVAKALGVTPNTISLWRKKYLGEDEE